MINFQEPFAPNYQDSLGVPLLAHAVMHKEFGPAAAKKLIDLGAKTNVFFSIKEQSTTNLLITSAKLHNDTFFTILENPEIDINFKQGGSFSALRACMACGFIKGIQKLLEKGAQIDWDVCVEVHKTHQWPSFKALLEINTPVLLNSEGQNLIHILAQQKTYYKGMRDSLALLAEKNDINLKDSLGFTPLDYAIKIKSVDVMNELLLCGADLMQTNKPYDEVHKINSEEYSKHLAEIEKTMIDYVYTYKDYKLSRIIFEKYKLRAALAPIALASSLEEKLSPSFKI